LDKLPKISVIIPTLNEEDQIKLLLDTLGANEDTEIFVVDGGSNDKTLNIVSEYTNVKILNSERGRAIQMNKGGFAAKAEYLLFLHADTIPPYDYIDQIILSLSRKGVIAGSFYLKFDISNFLLNIYSWFSRFNISIFTYGDQGIFIRKSDFQAINGYANISLMEDLEIQERIRKRGDFVKLSSAVVTSARKFEAEGYLWNQFKNMVLVGLYFLGVSPKKLAKFY